MRIELTSGIVTAEHVRDRDGGRQVFDRIGDRLFIVSLVADGSEAVLWDGTSYDAAILAAEDGARGWGCPVDDRVTE